MLILSFKRGEGAYVGRGIHVKVIKITVGGKEVMGCVKLGFEAPADTSISRDEFTLESHLGMQERREQDAAKLRP